MALPINTSILILFNYSLDLYDKTNAENLLNQIRIKIDAITDLISKKITLTNNTRNKIIFSGSIYYNIYNTIYSHELHLNNIIYKLEKILSLDNINELRLILINKISEISEISDLKINIYTNDSVIARSEDF